MDKAEFEKKRQEVLMRQEQFLRDNPTIGAWVKTKKILFGFLAIYVMLHTAVSIGIMVWLKELTVGSVGVIEYLPFMLPVPALLYIILMIMEALLPILLLAIAIYLTVPGKHREWSEQAETMYKATMQDLGNAVK